MFRSKWQLFLYIYGIKMGSAKLATITGSAIDNSYSISCYILINWCLGRDNFNVGVSGKVTSHPGFNMMPYIYISHNCKSMRTCNLNTL